MAAGYYEDGTITVALNGTSVTGTGTAFASRARVGDKLTRNGFSVPIIGPTTDGKTLTSNTALTLAWGFPVALTGATYKIELLPDLTRALEAMESLASVLGIGNLLSLAGLNGAGGDKGLMLNGAGSATTFALTAAARALLDDSSPAAMLATLGALGLAGGTTTGLVNVGAAGSAEQIRLYANGVTSGVFMGAEGTVVYGWFFNRSTGLLTLRYGATVAAAIAAPALVTITSTGAVTFGGAGAFTSLAASGALTVGGTGTFTGALTAAALAASGALTVGTTATVTGALSAASLSTAGALTVGGAGAFTGALTAAAGLMYGRGNVLGPVAQSAGVPTGALIEYGSNGAGSYVRFADGTQICWFRITFPTVTLTTPYGALFTAASDANRAYPAAFAAIPSTNISVTASSNRVVAFRQNTSTTTFWGAWAPVVASSGTTAVEAEFSAIGRWWI